MFLASRVSNVSQETKMKLDLGCCGMASFALCIGSAVLGQSAKPDESPRVLLSSPLGATAGVASKLVLRGLRLDQVSEVRVGEPPVLAKILSKGKVAVPPKQDVNRVGDSQIEVEIVLSPVSKSGEVGVTVVAPSGISAAHQLLVDALPLVVEKEPNDGFRQAQEIKLGDVIEGTLHQPQNVDVFRLEGTAGEKIICEVIAARRGSALDASLTLFDSRQRLIGSNDDQPERDGLSGWGTRDSRFELVVATTGIIYVVLQDAHDLGGPAHPYRLRVVRAEAQKQ
jgi:hypothetical protein